MTTNGKIPTSQMRQVDGWAWLAPGAAAAWLLFAFAATMRWGIRPTITSPDGAYRSYARQLWWWINRFARHVVVARPGTSNHGLGTAIDINNWARFPRAAFVAMARSYGFVFDTASENWHVHYLGAADYGSASTAGTILSHLKRGSRMFFILHPTKKADGSNHYYVCDGINPVHEWKGDTSQASAVAVATGSVTVQFPLSGQNAPAVTQFNSFVNSYNASLYKP